MSDGRTLRPIVIAYDGSELSQAATRQAAELFPGRPAIVATVWEPGLAMVMPMTSAGEFGTAGIPPDRETIVEADRVQHDHAVEVSRQGTELASSLGLSAEPYAVEDDLDVADTLIAIAKEKDGAAVVIGSHGISGLRARFLGGVARRLIEHSDRPVIVIREQN
jgi:nucleotide-binding universal stress UspA family protein